MCVCVFLCFAWCCFFLALFCFVSFCFVLFRGVLIYLTSLGDLLRVFGIPAASFGRALFQLRGSAGGSSPL